MTPLPKTQNTFRMGQPDTGVTKDHLTSHQIAQHWIIEDFEGLVNEITKFRINQISQYGANRKDSCKYNLSLRWVDFYKQMINAKVF